MPKSEIDSDADYFICPSCGDEVRIGPRGCPRCSSPPAKSEPDDPYLYDGLDLPDDDDFDYDEFVAREFGTGPKKKTAKEWFWWVVALILLIAFVFWALPF